MLRKILELPTKITILYEESNSAVKIDWDTSYWFQVLTVLVI